MMIKKAVSFIVLFSNVALAQVAQQTQNTTDTQGQRQDVTITTAVRQKLPAARAFAYMTNTTAKCRVATSGGAQFVGTGVTVGSSYEDDFCVLSEMIKLGKALGKDDEADNLYMLEYKLLIDKFTKDDKIICDYPTKCEKRR